MTSTEVFRLYRAIYSFRHVLTSFKNEQVKLVEVARTDEAAANEFRSLEPGRLQFCRKTKRLLVKCCDDQLLEVKQLSLKGRKKVMSAADFNNGFLKNSKESERKFE